MCFLFLSFFSTFKKTDMLSPYKLDLFLVQLCKGFRVCLSCNVCKFCNVCLLIAV